MLTALVRSLRAGVVTLREPNQPPERYLGPPRVRKGAALEELPAPAGCPAGAIAKDDARYAIDLARCVFCGRCADRSSAIEIGREVEIASRSRGRLAVTVERDAFGHLEPVAPPAALPVADAIRAALGRSLHLRHLDAGSCNACDWELTALLNPVYDVRRLGVDFVASPRHADGVIVTGPVTRNLEVAVRRTYEAVPEPRVVIAVGACAASGGIVGRSYASAGGVGELLPVDVLVPGCAPRPDAIIFGILLAVGRLEERARPS